jgi:hypothetical protein
MRTNATLARVQILATQFKTLDPDVLLMVMCFLFISDSDDSTVIAYPRRRPDA